MVKKCYVCSRRVCKINQISVHSFPKDLEIRQKWLNALNLTNKDDVSCTYVCSLHFTADDIERGSDLSKSRLKKGAVPSVNISNPNGYSKNGYDMYNSDIDYPFMPGFGVLAQLSENMYTNDNSFVDTEHLMPVSNVQCDVSFNEEPEKEVEQLNCQPDIELDCTPDIGFDCQPDIEQLACQPDLPSVSHSEANGNLNKTKSDLRSNEDGFTGFENTYASMTVSPEEYNYYETLFSDIDSVKYKKLHCTACNVHMGTAPIAHIHRYEHPLLKVLICEQCFNFYSSGDFEKDADGSELYCRWCGQGGQVYCCAKCPFVFCKKCIRRNIGQSMVTHIESSDDWLCYACDPKSIWMLRGLNWALKKYSQSKMSIGTTTRSEQDNKDIVTDYSMCCKDRAAQQNKGAKITDKNKRNSISSNHSDGQVKSSVKISTYSKTPKVSLERVKVPVDKQTGFVVNNVKSLAPENPLAHKSNINKPRPLLPKGNSNSANEVVCTPDIISLDDDSPPATPMKFNKPKPEPPKKFLQVKPASKLLDPVKNDSKIYKTIQYSTSLVSTPVNLQTLQNNPVVSGMIQNLQKHLRPGEPQKIIKIVSPDGRAFLIDPMKVPNSPTGQPTIIAAPETTHSQPSPTILNAHSSVPPPLHVLKQTVSNAVPAQQRIPVQRTKVWFDTSINGLRNISQMISTMIVSLVNDQKSLTNWVSLYNNFQTHLKTLSDNVENLKLQIRNEYLQTVHVGEPKRQLSKPQQMPPMKPKNNDYGQHFLSFVEEGHPNIDPQMLTAASQAAMNPGVILLNAQQPTLIPFSNNPLASLENVPIGANTNILKSMLNKPENGNNDEENYQSIPDDDVMFDPKDLLEQTLEIGEGTVDSEENESTKPVKVNEPIVVAEDEKEESGDEEVDEEKIKKLKEHLAEIQKEIAKRKTEKHKRKSEKKTDDIFDMDVTCDSDDESVHSMLSTKSSDSDSDCVVVDSENKKRKVKRKKSSSLNHSETENSETVKIETTSEDLNSTVESNEENSKKRKLDDVGDNEIESEVASKRAKIDENGETAETDNDKNENHTESNEIEEREKEGESLENEEKLPEEKTENESLSEKENTENSEQTSAADEFNPTDLMSIANAIRESIRESRNLTKPKEPKAKVGDVEQLLSSNVVFRKSENENGETSSTSKSSEKVPGNSYGDAFSNFLASSADDEGAELENELVDEQPSNDLDLPESNNSEQPTNNLDLPDDNNLEHLTNNLELPDDNNLEQTADNLDLPDGNNLQADSINSDKNNSVEIKELDELSKLDELQRITENIIANVTKDV
ncbi:uncharacterized protein LOC123298697 [Chrysoperla carnea]|uniref:uncharacterized protein LOC123298697 n=1 Tax=Chrysoperla carnea TaxID=189513 RepID=UPI001D08DBE3|nr:uncharacterized protein LOC123298697 [Chrysoperla carnea]